MRLHNLTRALLAFALLFSIPSANASGPRWVSGPPYYYMQGFPIVWYTDQPAYFTDPGDLSTYVNHAAADALVAAAASVWTLPNADLTLSYGGQLAEHVSSANVTFSSSGLIFPTDVQSTNYLNIPIAVIYDTDGSVTDLMLGSGASNPLNCRHAAVTESVDATSGSARILHAILVLNGRCTGPAPEQQLQLQYQLMRAFGRILGLGWSQTNDNVFTGTPTPSYQQELHWPIMHPIDIICGPYTYQCLPQPFTLRPDDIASLQYLYPVSPLYPVAGKQPSYADANQVEGTITFPNGQGMQGVNVVVHRLEPFNPTPEAWETASGVSGYLFLRDNGNPVTGTRTSALTNMGSPDTTYEGYYNITGIPIMGSDTWQNLVITTQPINPLYIGPYAVGPYDTAAVAPSGTTTTQNAWTVGSYGDVTINFAASTTASTCTATSDGTETSPSPINSQGWWNGTLCGYGHAVWSAFNLQSQRTATIEVTALDEQSSPTTAKAMPVLGLWNATDPTGTLPTVASAPAAFNGITTGTTSLAIPASAQPQQLRMVLADQRGDGRPDFNYQARVLYADTITPNTVPATGGTVTITGTGFRTGNTVTIDGTAVTVSSWTATTITATAPSLATLHSTTALTADVTVTDPSTNGTTTMSAALTYIAQPALFLIASPTRTIFTGIPTTTPFAVQALAADGVTPLPNQPITVTATTGQARFNACGATTCTLLTDINGKVTTTITALTPGTITLSAASSIGSVTANITAIARIQTITPLNPTQYIAPSALVSWTPTVTLTDNAASTINLPVQWQTTAGNILLTPPTTTTNAQSTTQTTATAGPLTSGTQATATACAWTTICTTFTTQAVDPSQWQIQIVSGSNQSLSAADTFAPVTLQITDAASHPIAGATVQIDQTLNPWTQPCPTRGRCPIAPISGSSTTSLTTATDGTITFTPLEAPGSPEITNIAAATGTQGFLAFTLQKQP